MENLAHGGTNKKRFFERGCCNMKMSVAENHPIPACGAYTTYKHSMTTRNNERNAIFICANLHRIQKVYEYVTHIFGRHFPSIYDSDESVFLLRKICHLLVGCKVRCDCGWGGSPYRERQYVLVFYFCICHFGCQSLNSWRYEGKGDLRNGMT